MSIHDTPASSLSLVDKTALDDPVCLEKGLIFTPEQFERFDYQYVRRLAAATETDEVNGKSDKFIVRSFFVRQHSLSEWEE